MDRQRAAHAIQEFLSALGHDTSNDLQGTGERVVDAWADDLLEGESIDAYAILREGIVANNDTNGNIVVLKDLFVATMCPHHLLPAFGNATVAYIPEQHIAGIGTIAHVLDVVSRRLTLQEHIGRDFCNILISELGARGVLCKLSLTHTCLVLRGERKHGAKVETLAFAGTFNSPGSDRDLAIRAIL